MPGRPYQFLLPESVDARLEQLTSAVRGDGHHASRSDLVGALIWNFAGDGDDMSQVVRRYLAALPSDPVIEVERRPPGPRPLIPTTTQRVDPKQISTTAV